MLPQKATTYGTRVPEYHRASKNTPYNTHQITLSHKAKATQQTKNFVVLSQGIPVKDRIFEIFTIDQHNNKIKIPVFKTDSNGVIYMLTHPKWHRGYKIDIENSIYQPLKFSKRLGFVIKDYEAHYQSYNPFYRSNILGRYIDLGISEHFIRTLMLKSDLGQNPIDGRDNIVIKNWQNTIMGSDITRQEYKSLNTHTERTKRSARNIEILNYGLISSGALGIATVAGLATAGIVPFVSTAIAGAVFGVGSLGTVEDRFFKQNPADISRQRDTQSSADETLQS